jgi:hypothetical protein
MQSHSTQHFSEEQISALLEQGNVEDTDSASGIVRTYYTVAEDPVQPTQFQSHFTGCMELYADAQTVTQYLDAHRGWFCRCAPPMKVEPIGENGYILGIGRYGSFGYNVEPKIGLNLLPQDQGIYRIQTIPLPDQESLNYHVDFHAALQLLETPSDEKLAKSPGNELTRVEWQLNLGVTILFPRFIYKLPLSLIQRTGDRLLAQIVRQVSHRLTAKVQEDFHSTLGTTPPRRFRKQRITKD